MAISGNVEVKVSPAELLSKAETVSAGIANMENQCGQLEQIINRTSSYWIGEAGDMHRTIYQNQKLHIEEMMKRLKEHPADLIVIAQTYIEAEERAESLASGLPGDVIY